MDRPGRPDQGQVGGLCSQPRHLSQALRPAHTFNPRALQVSKSACVLTTQAIMRLLKSKDAAAAVDIRTWPTILDTGEGPRRHRCVHWPPGHTTFPFFVVRIVRLPPNNRSWVGAAEIGGEGPLASGPPSWRDPCTRGAEALVGSRCVCGPRLLVLLLMPVQQVAPPHTHLCPLSRHW